MSENLPKFTAPPVIETVLSAQFNRLHNFTNAHSGWFWRNYLDDTWIDVKEAPRIEDQFERFGDDKAWKLPGGITVKTGPESERLQIFRQDGERLIQIQSSRFIYNWRKKEGHYPTFEKLLPEFLEQFDKFQQFARDSGNGDLRPNQWEVTYVNHILKGELWQSSDEWVHIVPGLCGPAGMPAGHRFDSSKNEWRFVIGNNFGRLYVVINHVKVGGERGPEALLLQLMARGPMLTQDRDALVNGFHLGHESIVRSFAAITSDFAHSHWKRTV